MALARFLMPRRLGACGAVRHAHQVRSRRKHGLHLSLTPDAQRFGVVRQERLESW
jgi:hypothetical protein